MNAKGYTADGKAGNKCSAGGENGRLCLRCMPMVMGVSERVFVLCVQEPSGLVQVKQLCETENQQLCETDNQQLCETDNQQLCVKQTPSAV